MASPKIQFILRGEAWPAISHPTNWKAVGSSNLIRVSCSCQAPILIDDSPKPPALPVVVHKRHAVRVQIRNRNQGNSRVGNRPEPAEATATARLIEGKEPRNFLSTPNADVFFLPLLTNYMKFLPDAEGGTIVTSACGWTTAKCAATLAGPVLAVAGLCTIFTGPLSVGLCYTYSVIDVHDYAVCCMYMWRVEGHPGVKLI